MRCQLLLELSHQDTEGDAFWTARSLARQHGDTRRELAWAVRAQASRFAVVKSAKVGEQPEGVKAPDGKLAYVSSEENETISVFDPVAGKILKTIKVGHWPRSVPGVFPSVESSPSGLMRTTKRGCYVRRLSEPSPFPNGTASIM